MPAVDVTDGNEMRRLVLILWHRRTLILSTAVVGVLCAVSYVLIVTPTYSATVTLVSTDSNSGAGALSGALGSLAGLASLADVKVGNDDQVTEAIALLKSRKFTTEFVEQNKLLPILFSKKWDVRRSAWRVGADDVPTFGDAFRLFDKKIRRVTQDKRDGVIVLTILWKDRFSAAAWANQLVARLNDVMRARVISESTAMIEQLEKKAATTTLVPLQQALATLIEAEVKKKTLAAVRSDYVFRVIDPAVPADRRDVYSPKRALTISAGGLLGLLIGILGTLVHASFTGNSDTRFVDADGS